LPLTRITQKRSSRWKACGLGEKKRAEFGAVFAAEIAEYLKTSSRMAFE
jgi:hypothetical protein